MSEVKMLDFNYTITGISDTTTSVWLDFENPEYVSITPEFDKLVVFMTDYRDSKGELIAKDHVMRVNIPPQGSESVPNIAGTATGTAIGLNYFLNLALG